MTRADFIRMARELGITGEFPVTGSMLEMFGAAVEAAAIALERERCAKYLRDAALRLEPDGKRTNQVDRHTARVLATTGDELADGLLGPNV